MLWPHILSGGIVIGFAYESFKWANLASNNAGVTVVVAGLMPKEQASDRKLFIHTPDGIQSRSVNNINAYLVPGNDIFIDPESNPINSLPKMFWGCKPVDGGALMLDFTEKERLEQNYPRASKFIRRLYGSTEFIDGTLRYCLWVNDSSRDEAGEIPPLAARFARVRELRASSKAAETRPAAEYPHRFRQIQGTPGARTIVVPIHSSESREWLPIGTVPLGAIVSNAAFGIYDAPDWAMALAVSRIHLVWIAAICGKLETRYRYSNTLGWNTFPVPKLTEQSKADLTRTAENILLAREVHFPATIADLYDPEDMPDDLRRAHEENDEVLERIYIGRRFRNDTERLEKLFDLYTKMTTNAPKPRKARKAA